jgi:hypothetical protein
LAGQVAGKRAGLQSSSFWQSGQNGASGFQPS